MRIESRVRQRDWAIEGLWQGLISLFFQLALKVYKCLGTVLFIFRNSTKRKTIVMTNDRMSATGKDSQTPFKPRICGRIICRGMMLADTHLFASQKINGCLLLPQLNPGAYIEET